MAAYLLFFRGQWGSSYTASETRFAIADTAAIARVVLTQTVQGEARTRIQLDRQPDGDTWLLDGQYPAFRPRVAQLLKALHLVQVRERLYDQGLVSAERILRTMHTRIEVYDHDGRLMQDIYMGTPTKDAKGTLMQRAEARTPYIVELPGLQGYVNASFPLEQVVWRENLLFRARRDQLAMVSVSYADAARSFVLTRDTTTGAWLLGGAETPPDSARLAGYLDRFTGAVYAETFATDRYPGMIDKLRTRQPDIVFSVATQQGALRRIVLFTRDDNPNNLFGWVEGSDELLTIQHFVFDKYLVDRAYFLEIPL
ncbi:MAG: hypothetical protein OHK0039_31090 [Bacteroidia bacterium]